MSYLIWWLSSPIYYTIHRLMPLTKPLFLFPSTYRYLYKRYVSYGMNTFTKSILIAFIALFIIGILWGCYKIFVLGNYFENASFITSALIILGAIIAIYFAFIAIKSILKNNNSL